MKSESRKPRLPKWLATEYNPSRRISDERKLPIEMVVRLR